MENSFLNPDDYETRDDYYCAVMKKYDSIDKQNCILWLAGKVDELRNRGLMCEDGDQLTPQGIAAYDQLAASGYRPPEELAMPCIIYENGGDEDAAMKLWQLIQILGQ